MGELVAVRAPVENVNDETIAILKWLVQNGDRVEKDAPLLLAETTKTSFDVVAPSRGFVWKVAADSGEVPTGALLCYVGDELDAVQQAAAKEQSNGSGSATDTTAGEAVNRPAETTPAATRFSGKALALIKSFGMDPGEFAGRGLVRERDVLERAGERQATPAAAPATGGVATRVEKLPRSKRVEAQYLRSALASTIPSIATIAVPTGGFFTKSNSRPDLVGFAGAAVIFEASRLLRKYPVFNAFHDDGSVRYYEDVNIGYAFDLGSGLKVPVIRHADRKSLPDILAEKQQRLVEYINDSLPVEAFAGGTFTITDLSGDDVFHFNPVLNQGQSAILGVCAELFSAPGARGTFNLVLAFDHQLAEGRSAAAFLRDLRDRLIGHEQSLGRGTDDPSSEPRCSICRRPVTELQENHQFLIQTIADRFGAGTTVCSICLQVW